jgi:O-Antigen ligase
MNWFGIFSDQKARRQWDWHLVIFFLNVFLVVYGYNVRGPGFQVLKAFRTVLVMFSLASLFLLHGQVKYVFSEKKSWILWVFILINLLVVPFSVDFMWSLERLLAWLPFLIYTNYFIVYLFTQYNKDEAKIKLLQIFNLAYLFPVFLLFSAGIVFQTTNIYGQNVGWYKANVLGWACTLFVLTGFDLYVNRPTPVWLRNLFFVVAVLCLWGVVLTGSRSSYVALVAAAMVLVLRSKRISFKLKVGITICLVGFASYILLSPDSVVNLRAKYADIRNQKGEIRLQLAQKATDALLKHPGLIFTGFGFDNFRAGLKAYGGVKTDLASHNSYLELFFSGGIFNFLFFIVFLVYNAIVKYIRFDSRRFVFVPMILIIPYFETNLNAGQFLFFPWMTFLFYYAHITSFQTPISAINIAPKKMLGWRR